MASSDKQDNGTPPQRPRKRLPVLTIMTMAGAAGLSWLTATSLVEHNAARLLDTAQTALADSDHDWLSVQVDGTRVHIFGTVPDEVTRYRALLGVETAIDTGRVIDDMQVASDAAPPPPAFEAELLRNDQGISIIGLVPAGLNRAAVLDSLQKGTRTAQITDLLETADYPVPDHWDAAFSFGLRAVQLAERAKVSIRPGEVMVQAIADDQPARQALIAALQRNAPGDITLIMDVSAPRPVISPFALRLVRDGDGTRLDSCTADDEAAQKAIWAAAAAAGVTGRPDCPLGLGAPTPEWGQAAVTAINAVAALDQGSVTLLDGEVSLTAPATVPEADFDAVAARLADDLPKPFTLSATRAADPDAPAPAVEFLARVTNPGHVILEGLVSDMRMRDAVESFARSRFGQVQSSLQLDPDLPAGWTARTIAGLEAMADLRRGGVEVGPDLIRLAGVSGDKAAADAAAQRLAERLGAGAAYEMQISYDRRLDPLLGLPSGTVCVDQLNTIMRESLIGFEPNRSVIAGDPEPTLALLAQAMQDCSDFRIELGGHTDSQGSAGFNAELSQKRANTLLKAMTDHGIDTTLMVARGYGASQPIADNDTDAGREANRRIEFRLLSEDPVQVQPPAPAPLVSGVTRAPGAAAAGSTRQPDGLDLQPVPQAPEGARDIWVLPDLNGVDPQGTGPERMGHDAALAQMAATFLVTELAVSPAQAFDIAVISDGQADDDGLAAIIAAATSVVQIVFAAPPGDIAVHAATTVARTVLDQGVVPILTPDENTPRPAPAPEGRAPQP